MSHNRILLDTSLLLAAMDESGNTSDEKRYQAKHLMEEMLRDGETAFVITPLIRYEVLRGVEWMEPERYQRLKEILNRFLEISIGREVSEMAADLYRFDVNEAKASEMDRNFEKRKFDIFHFATAKYHQLEVRSLDGDFQQIQELFDRSGIR